MLEGILAVTTRPIRIPAKFAAPQGTIAMRVRWIAQNHTLNGHWLRMMIGLRIRSGFDEKRNKATKGE